MRLRNHDFTQELSSCEMQKKTPSRAAGRASSPRCFDWILLGQFVGVKLPCKWTNWNFLVPEIVGRYLKSQMLFWPSLLQLGLIDW